MLKNLADTLNKTCLLGLTYFDLKGNIIKQSLLGGTVTSVDADTGITIALIGQQKPTEKPAEFIIPTNLSCWFKAPSGEFNTSQDNVKIKDPDFLVTWDIYQTQSDTAEGEQQWWEWVARTEEPNVNGAQ